MLPRPRSTSPRQARGSLAACAWALCLGWLAAGAAAAAPIVSIDLDPSTPGIQDTASVWLLDSVSVDIVIGDVDPAMPLFGDQFDVDFDAGVLTATSVAGGGFLNEPLFPIQADLAGGRVEFAEITLGPVGSAGSGVLGRIEFDAVGLGTTSLQLGELILAGEFGVEIAPGSMAGARLTVSERTGGQPPVPEPGAALVFASGLAVVGTLARRRSG
ncbi:MAG: hypothetical protein ACQGVK_13140 [Myxococcota bacterium]